MNPKQARLELSIGSVSTTILTLSNIVIWLKNNMCFTDGGSCTTFLGNILQTLFITLLAGVLIFSTYSLTIGKNKISTKLQNYAKGSLQCFSILAGVMLVIIIGYVIAMSHIT